MAELFANSGDHDQTPRSAASDLGSALFASYPFRGLKTTMGYLYISTSSARFHLRLQLFDTNTVKIVFFLFFFLLC